MDMGQEAPTGHIGPEPFALYYLIPSSTSVSSSLLTDKETEVQRYDMPQPACSGLGFKSSLCSQ